MPLHPDSSELAKRLTARMGKRVTSITANGYLRRAIILGYLDWRNFPWDILDSKLSFEENCNLMREQVRGFSREMQEEMIDEMVGREMARRELEAIHSAQEAELRNSFRLVDFCYNGGKEKDPLLLQALSKGWISSTDLAQMVSLRPQTILKWYYPRYKKHGLIITNMRYGAMLTPLGKIILERLFAVENIATVNGGNSSNN